MSPLQIDKVAMYSQKNIGLKILYSEARLTLVLLQILAISNHASNYYIPLPQARKQSYPGDL